MNTQVDAAFIQADKLAQAFTTVREQTMALVAPLSAEDCCAQSMPDASPAKWHLAHTTWFFETFILEPYEPDFAPFDTQFRVLFNSYYNGVGQKHPRPQRGLLTRPSLERVSAYRRNVDARMLQLIQGPHAPMIGALVELGLHHEQQHQELLLTDIKHLLSHNPQQGAYAPPRQLEQATATELTWVAFDGGLVEIGHAGDGFSFDNELPRHRHYLEPYQLASRLVSNAEYLAFIHDGGYANPMLWLSEAWDWLQASSIKAPLYWVESRLERDCWQEFTLHGLEPLDPASPVTHLSYFEADAYARWYGARLPTEAQWENAAGACMMREDAVASLHPNPAAESPKGMLCQMLGACWQWTSSAYSPYPGYAPAAGAIGEYNGKFMVNQYVLRGSSCVTPSNHARASYRNFFPAGARWQFSGIRLARS